MNVPVNNLPNAPEGTTRIGHLLAPHGVQGGIKLFVLGDQSQISELKRVYVQGKGWLRLSRTEPLAPGLVLHLAGINSRDAAADLRGLQVYAADTELPALDEGSYYYHDLRGLPVQDAAGTLLGEVEDVEDMGHQDVLVVAHAGGTALLPLQAPYILVEQTGGKPSAIRLSEDAPEGLFGDDASGDDEPQEPEED